MALASPRCDKRLREVTAKPRVGQPRSTCGVIRLLIRALRRWRGRRAAVADSCGRLGWGEREVPVVRRGPRYGRLWHLSQGWEEPEHEPELAALTPETDWARSRACPLPSWVCPVAWLACVCAGLLARSVSSKNEKTVRVFECLSLRVCVCVCVCVMSVCSFSLGKSPIRKENGLFAGRLVSGGGVLWRCIKRKSQR